MSSLSHLLFRRSGSLLAGGLFVALIAGGITLLFPLSYRADTQLLIIPQTRSGVDPYTVVKSAERIGANIAQVVATNDFFTKVHAQPGHRIDWSRFENVTERVKRKRWQKTVDASVVYGTGLLTVSAYSVVPDQAIQLADAAGSALVANGSEYVGGDVIIKIVNGPVATSFPVRPNLIVNVVAGFVVGVVLTGLLIARKRHSV